jgi:hypothetical protein
METQGETAIRLLPLMLHPRAGEGVWKEANQLAVKLDLRLAEENRIGRGE